MLTGPVGTTSTWPCMMSERPAGFGARKLATTCTARL